MCQRNIPNGALRAKILWRDLFRGDKHDIIRERRNSALRDRRWRIISPIAIKRYKKSIYRPHLKATSLIYVITCQLTCYKEQCRVTICVPMVREGCRHRRSRLDSTSACNRSIPESRKKSCERVDDLEGMKVLIDYREAFVRTKKNGMKIKGTRKSFPLLRSSSFPLFYA